MVQTKQVHHVHLGRLLLLLILELFAGGLRSARGAELPERTEPAVQTPEAQDLAEATQLNDESGKLFRNGDYRAAFDKARQALFIRQRVYKNQDHLDVAYSLNNVGSCLGALRRTDEAVKALEQALAMKRRLYKDQDNSDLALSLKVLASCFQKAGRYKEALPLFQDTLAMEQRLFNQQDDPEVASALTYVGLCLRALGRDNDALVKYKEALAMNQRIFKDQDHPEIATSLNNIAFCLESMGRSSEALPLFENALEMKRRLFKGKENPTVARALNNLAGCLDALGRFDEALPLYQQALQMTQRIYGQHDDPEIASSLDNIAACLNSLGRPLEALPFTRQSLAMYKRLYPNQDHPDLAISMDNVAFNMDKLGLTADALPLFEQALAMNQRIFKGNDHPSICRNLNNVAHCLKVLGRNDQALPLFQEAADMSKRLSNDGDHPDRAFYLNSLATALTQAGRNEEAVVLVRQALKMNQRVFKDQIHPRVANNLSQLGYVCATLGQRGEAITHFSEGWDMSVQIRQRFFLLGSQRDQAAYADHVFIGRGPPLSLAVKLSEEPLARRLAAKVVLADKGAATETVGRRIWAALSNADPQLQPLYEDWRKASFAFAAASMASPSLRQMPDFAAHLAELAEKAEASEKALAQASARFSSEQNRTAVTVSQVIKSLSATTALIEYAKYREISFDEKKQKEFGGNWRYLAVIIRGGAAASGKEEDNLSLLDLGDAQTIEATAEHWRELFVGFHTRGLVASQAKAPGDTDALQQASEALAKLIWTPLAAHLGDAKRVYISPDGALSFIPFAALPGANRGTFVLDDYDLSYVASGRDLIRSGSISDEPVLLIGNPDYGPAGNDVSAKPNLATRPTSTPLLTAQRASGQQGYFDPLAGTSAELQAVAKIERDAGKSPRVLTGKSATEAAVKSVRHPSVLFLATHGFFLPAQEASSPDDPDNTSDLQTLNDISGAAIAGSAAVWQRFQEQGPMRRSGLALAGANDTLAGRHATGGDDGILTAEEVIGIDLWGTKLVVLSACESGLGDLRGSEGVYGLRRAFALAGAQNLVMSLWQVDDKATSTLIPAMYARFTQGQNPQQALLAAQRDYIAAQRKEGHYPHPYYWAAFVASGNGTGLEKNEARR